jgi:hypothetical protein
VSGWGDDGKDGRLVNLLHFPFTLPARIHSPPTHHASRSHVPPLLRRPGAIGEDAVVQYPVPPYGEDHMQVRS